VGCGELDHLARTDQQYFLLGEARKYPAGELDRGSRHRDDVGADAGIASHFLRHRKRALEKLVEQCPERTGGLGDANRLFHLAEDLRLADHHGIEARGDAKRVPNRFALWEGIEVGLELLGLDAVIAGEPFECCLRLARAQ